MADSVLRILENEYAQKRIQAELEKDRRREETFARIPELQALDIRKRRLIVSRFRAKRAGNETGRYFFSGCGYRSAYEAAVRGIRLFCGLFGECVRMLAVQGYRCLAGRKALPVLY